MSDNFGVGHALIGIGVYGNWAEQRRGNEYQRQQLNLMRYHQGLPLVPPSFHSAYDALSSIIGGVGLVVSLFVWATACAVVDNYVPTLAILPVALVIAIVFYRVTFKPLADRQRAKAVIDRRQMRHQWELSGEL